ncbi:MAG: prephenate dehydrogenase [Dehalococcoidia bacterium]
MGKLAIVGLGLIGGSMGLALSKASSVKAEIVGYDRDYEVAQRAQKAGAVQSIAPSLEQAVRGASLVIVATPILAIRRVFDEMAPYLQSGAVVTDTASTKGEILQWADELLPSDIHFIGGHPMAGKEKAGPGAAEATLFQNRPYCIVPGVRAADGAVHSIVGLAEAVGGNIFFLDAAEHDAYAAAISHLPLLTSIALFKLAKGSSAWPELGGMAGPAFYDLTRLASGQPEMSQDIFVTNKENVLHWLDRYILELQKMADMIREDDREKMFRDLASVQFERDTFVQNPPRREEQGARAPMPSSAESFMSIMAGSLWSQRSKDLEQSMEERQKARQAEERLRRRDI